MKAGQSPAAGEHHVSHFKKRRLLIDTRVLGLALIGGLALGGCGPVEESDAKELLGTIQAAATDADNAPGSPTGISTSPNVYTFFTNPGTASGNTDTKINDKLTELVNNTPAGATIRAGVHEWGYAPLNTAMRNAAARKVHIYITMKYHPAGYAGHDMLQKNENDYPSYFHYVRCGTSTDYAACISPAQGGFSHTKLFTFSRTKLSASASSYTDNVHFNMSANQGSNGQTQFNNAVLVANSPSSYNAWSNYLSHMYAQSPKSSDIYSATSEPQGAFYDANVNMQGYLFPRGDGKDTVAEALKLITQPYNATSNPCELRIAATNFSNGRPAIYNEILRIGDTLGCKVYLAYTNLTESYYTELNDRTKHPNIQIQRLKRRLTSSSPCIYIHSKYFIFKGKYNGSTHFRKLIWMGSHNFEGSSLTKTDEVMARFEDNETYGAYENDFANIWYYAQVNLGGSTETTCD